MNARFLTLLVFVVCCSLLLPGNLLPSMAQDPVPSAVPKGERDPCELRQTESLEGPWFGLQGCVPSSKLAGAVAPPTGGPDDFGYIWDNRETYSWVDAAALGEDTGITGDDAIGQVDIGFPFKFYEQEYSQVHISTNGLLVFDGANPGCSGGYCYGFPVPLPTSPNNFVAPYWDDLTVGGSSETGIIYTLLDGTVPNRRFVVEWHGVPSYYEPAHKYTFQVILNEADGDIIMQYQTMTGTVSYGTAGIEDSLGFDGLAYAYQVYDDLAIRFERPTPAPRVSAWPPYQGGFSPSGQEVGFDVLVRNTGEMGEDTYDLSVSSAWQVDLYAAGGHIPLADSDGDSTIDTGPIAPGESTTIVARVQAPSMANVGDDNTANLTLRSSLDTSITRTVHLQTAIPAPFAQVYRDDSDGAMRSYHVQPGFQKASKATPYGFSGEDLAVAEMPDGFAYFWTREDTEADPSVTEIEYTLLDQWGETIRGVSKLVDHSGVTVPTKDLSPAVAVAPNGRIGVLWYRLVEKSESPKYCYDTFLAVLEPDGDLLVPPINLTSNPECLRFAPLVPEGSPPYEVAAIAATDDNRFLLAWWHRKVEGTSSLDDIYYAVRTASGGEVLGATKLTNDVPGASDAYLNPNLAALDGNRALLTLTRAGGYRDIYYAALDSAGNLLKEITNLTNDGPARDDWRSDAAQMHGGNVAVGWTCSEAPDYAVYDICYAMLDEGLNRILGPTRLDNPVDLVGNAFVSVAPAERWAALTWMHFFYYYRRTYRRNLYYALLDGAGSVATGPTIFRTSQAWGPYLFTSYAGQGNTSFSRVTPVADKVDAVLAAPASASRPPGERVAASVQVSNHGLITATSVVLNAEWDSTLEVVDVFPPPTSQSGDTMSWNLPDLGFLGGGPVTLVFTVLGTPLMMPYPLTWTITTDGPEANPADNTAITRIMAALQSYLPLVRKGR